MKKVLNLIFIVMFLCLGVSCRPKHKTPFNVSQPKDSIVILRDDEGNPVKIDTEINDPDSPYRQKLAADINGCQTELRNLSMNLSRRRAGSFMLIFLVCIQLVALWVLFSKVVSLEKSARRHREEIDDSKEKITDITRKIKELQTLVGKVATGKKPETKISPKSEDSGVETIKKTHADEDKNHTSALTGEDLRNDSGKLNTPETGTCPSKENHPEEKKDFSPVFAKNYRDGEMEVCQDRREADFELTLSSEINATFRFVGDFQHAKENKDGIFDGVADVRGRAIKSIGIQHVEDGAAELTQSGKWKVIKKAVVSFINE